MAIALANPHGSPIQSVGLLPNLGKAPPTKSSMWTRLGLGRWLHHRDESRSRSPATGMGEQSKRSQSQSDQPQPKSALARRLSRRVGVGLPRHPTFKRQMSERRDRLSPVEDNRRALSVDRRRPLSLQRTRSPPGTSIARLSAPEITWQDQVALASIEDAPTEVAFHEPPSAVDLEPLASVPSAPDSYLRRDDPDDPLEWELEQKWILNLSMHFRDKSEREKFFVTYAETPSHWRRVTISCDYRGAAPDSLEQDLKDLHYQRDKSARIYESIRDSLPEIQFYDTVTNLKLETSDGRLHVHVTEDVNEIIPYPPVSSVRHLGAQLISERDLRFDGHLSGFVYRVQWQGKTYIKKEIPGPDTVDEFLYEINALHALCGSRSVIGFEGIIVDDHGEVVKGLLISYAEQGALVDVLYDYRGQLTLARRERWAKQIVQGLCEIHEAGYVQGDFTLSNVVIDSADNAKIIDINRRGCPVGWEPPEIGAKIESNQRISMYIGVKSDLFQLGMTLWALAMQEDEPERQIRPLTIPTDVKVPEYYRKIVAICLSDRPQDRLSAKELLGLFPNYLPDAPNPQVTDNSAFSPDGPKVMLVPRYSSSQTSLSLDRSVSLDGDVDDATPNVVYVTPAEYFDSLSPHSDYVDYPPRGRQPATYSLRLSDLDTPSLSPNPYTDRLSDAEDDENLKSHQEPAPSVLDITYQRSTAEDNVSQLQTPHASPVHGSPSYDHPPHDPKLSTVQPPLRLSMESSDELYVRPETQPVLPNSEQLSLFTSQLPINPALASDRKGLSEENHLTGDMALVTNEEKSLESPKSDSTQVLLSESQLPPLGSPLTPSEYDLPANTSVEAQEIPKDENSPQVAAEPAPIDQIEASPPSEFVDVILTESQLPINPAIKIDGSETELQNLPVTPVPENNPPLQDDFREDEARIPLVNPQPVYNPSIDTQPSAPPKQFEDEASNRGGDHSIILSTESCPEKTDKKLPLSSNPLLLNSTLPINPASSLCLDQSCLAPHSSSPASL